MRRALPIVVLLIILVAIVVVIARSATPSIDLPTQVSTLGQATPIAVHVADKYGVRSASATVEQNGAGFPVWQMAQPSKAREATWNFTVGVKTTPQLKDGKAYPCCCLPLGCRYRLRREECAKIAAETTKVLVNTTYQELPPKLCRRQSGSADTESDAIVPLWRLLSGNLSSVRRRPRTV